MRKPSREVVETLLDKVLSHGMSEFGGNVIELPVAQSGPGGTIRALRQIQLPDGMEVAPVKLGKRDSRERGHLFPQTEPVHPLDVTTMQMPLHVDRWELELEDGDCKSLCLLAAYRLGTSVNEALGLPAEDSISVAAVFQTCEHGTACTQQPPGFTSRFSDQEEDERFRGPGVLSYVTLALVRSRQSICTLLSCIGSRVEDCKTVAKLEVHSNNFEEAY